MATDKSEPKVGIILRVAVVSIVLLVAIRFGLTSYFHKMEDSLKADRLNEGKSEVLKEVQAKETTLSNIDQAMRDIATRKRDTMPAVAPAAASGPPEIPCWSGLPCPSSAAEAGAPAPGPATTGGSPGGEIADAGAAAAVDGAVPLSGDAAAPPAADAGAKVAPRDAGTNDKPRGNRPR